MPWPSSTGPRSVSGEVLDAALVSETSGWVLTQVKLLTTSDAGEAWRAVPLLGPATPQRAAAALDPQRLWVVTILGPRCASTTLTMEGRPGAAARSRPRDRQER